jgi:hypothetical protein
MPEHDIAIASVSWVRTESEETILRNALAALAALEVPVFITDGGSPPSFVSFLKSFAHFSVYQAKGLWPQAKQSITAAGASDANMILYTEPDKKEFFQHYLPHMLQGSLVREKPGVQLASRSAKGFASFPAFQQMTEFAINQSCKEIIGKDIDYCYGPFLFNSGIIPFLDVLPENCGWGWRPFVFAVAHRLGLTVDAFVGDFLCPPDQREDDASERVYRMKQLSQNIDGLVLAATLNLQVHGAERS